MRDILLYNADRYDLRVNGHSIYRAYHHIAKGDIVEIEERGTGLIYRDIYEGKNPTHSLVFLKLAGEIYVERAEIRYFPCAEEILYSDMIDGNSVHVEYDGITHITIEDRDYIYRYDLPYYSNVDIKYKDNIFLIIIDFCEKRRIIIVSKPSDYVEMLNIEGNEVRIGENCIYVTNVLGDSLGRIRHAEYILDGDMYICSKVYFDYTYTVHYDISMTKYLIEDAVYARDYHYIANKLDSPIEEVELKEYFESILSNNFDILREDISSDVMHFIVYDDTRTYLKNIRLYLTKDGRIANFDEDKNE